MEGIVREVGKPSSGDRHGVHAERCKIREEAKEPIRTGAQSTRSSGEAGNDRGAKGCRKVEGK